MRHRLLTAVSIVVVLIGPAVPLPAQSVEQGVQLFNARQYVEARATLLPYGERDANAAYYLGRIEMGNDDPAKAAEWLERAVAMNPKNATYYDWLGRAYGAQAQRANMLRLPFLAKKTKSAWETGLVVDPDNLDLREDLMSYYTQAPGFVGGSKEKAHEMLLEIKKRNAYRGSAAAATLCLGEKDLPCVERELTGMVASYPDSAAVYAQLAVYYANQKQFDKAFAVLDQRLKVKPNELTTLYQVGRTASLSGQNLERGEQALKTVLGSPVSERSPSPASAHYRLGTIYEKKGAKDLAREEYRATLLLVPGHADARKALAALK